MPLSMRGEPIPNLVDEFGISRQRVMPLRGNMGRFQAARQAWERKRSEALQRFGPESHSVSTDVAGQPSRSSRWRHPLLSRRGGHHYLVYSTREPATEGHDGLVGHWFNSSRPNATLGVRSGRGRKVTCRCGKFKPSHLPRFIRRLGVFDQRRQQSQRRPNFVARRGHHGIIVERLG